MANSNINLVIITNHQMEGAGLKKYIDEKKPEYNTSLFITPINYNLIDLDTNNFSPENTVIFLDTDSFENSSLFDFLEILNNKNLKCIIYSRLLSPGLMLQARKRSIDGYLSKNSSLPKLLDCLTVIELGGYYYDSCFNTIIREILNFEQYLSQKERIVFYESIIFENRTIRQLSENLKISKHSVEVHLSHIYEKAGVGNYGELVTKFSL